MDLLELLSSQSHFFVSGHLYIFAFDIKVTKSFDFGILKVIGIGIADYSYKKRKSLMLIVVGKALF